MRGTLPNPMNDTKVTAPFFPGAAFGSTGITPISSTIICSRKNCLFLTILLSMSSASCLSNPFATYISAISDISPSKKFSISHSSLACSFAT